MPYFVPEGSQQHEIFRRAHAGIMLVIACVFSGDYATIKCGDYATQTHLGCARVDESMGDQSALAFKLAGALL